MSTQTTKPREELKGLIKGNVLIPEDPGYEEARQIWNAMIDRRPAAIVQCMQADDVPPVIRFVRENGLELSIRGAGHNIAGSALCDNGVTIDFSRMKKVHVDARRSRAYVEPGATLADLDGRWDQTKDDQRCIAWARDFFKASAPYASAGAYVNFMTAEEGERVAAAYGSNYDRLVQIKKRYDPENVFHLNQNIKP
jgi:FAD/FMN-containing dehydrogenase